jgi:hypothetical protein
MKELMMNMTKKTMVYGMGGAFLALALILGACAQPTDSSGEDGALGANVPLEVSGVVHKNDAPTYTPISDGSANGTVTATSLTAFAGTIENNELNGAISGTLGSTNTSLTALNDSTAGNLINAGLQPTGGTKKFTIEDVTPKTAKYVELKLKAGTKDLSNEKVESNWAQYQRYVYVSEEVTIKAKGTVNFSITRPAGADNAGGNSAAMSAEDITLVLQKGWNLLLESYDLGTVDPKYTFTREKMSDANWVLKN